MGFSLKYFLNELLDVINDSSLSEGEKVQLITECIEFNTQYAIDCEQLDAN